MTADCIEVAPYFHPLVCADQDLIARPSRPSPAPLEVAQPDIACSTPARQGRCVANRFLRRKLANAAEKNGRSLNSEILHRLDQTFGEEFLQFVAELEKREWPAPGSEDTELGVLMELEVGHGETEVYSRVQA